MSRRCDINFIRRWVLRDQMSIREISRRNGLARNTLKKHLPSEKSEPKYPRRFGSSKLDPYAEKLATWLGIETKIAETAAHFEADPHDIPTLWGVY